MSVTANLTTNVETITATIVVEDETIIVQVSAAARGPAGEAGAAGAAGPNTLTTATTTNLTGFISGNGTNISGATAAATTATANTLVLRSAGGGASFAGLNTNSGSYAQIGGENFNVATTSNANLTTTGSGTVIVSGAGGTTISGGTLTFSPSGFAYGAGAASAHRTALGLATTDSPTFAQITVGVGSRITNLGGVRFGDQFDLVSLVTNSDFGLTRSNTARIVLGQNGVGMRQEGAVSWTGTVEATDAKDLLLLRDAANTLAQRNGTAAQESRIYGTYTGAGDYRRLALKMSTAGVAQIVAEGAGTGAAGNMLLLHTGNNIITKSADFTLAETDAATYMRLTKTGSTQTITLPTTGISTGAEFQFYRATTQALAFAGSATVNGTANLASVPNNGAFALKHLGSGTYDFI